jgi:hypothetical protein
MSERERVPMDAFNVALTRDEIAIIQVALSEHLTFLLKEWEHQESLGETDAAASLFERADNVRTLMNKVGVAPLNLRSFT